MKYIPVLIKNQINRFEFKLCFAVLFLLNIAGMVIAYVLNYQQDAMSLRSAADNYVMVSTYTDVIRHLLTFLFPLLAAGLCAGYHRKNDELPVMLRLDRRRYVYGNALVAVVITAVTVMAVFTVNQLLCMAAFPLSATNNVWGALDYEWIRSYAWEYLYEFWAIQNSYVYNFLFIMNMGILSGGIALLTYGLGYIKIMRRRNPILLVVLVYVLFIGLLVVSQLFHIPLLNYTGYIEAGHQIGVRGFLCFAGSIYVVGLLLTIRGKRAYENI